MICIYSSNEKKPHKASHSSSILLTICVVAIFFVYIFKRETSELLTCFARPELCIYTTNETDEENSFAENVFLQTFPKIANEDKRSKILIYSHARSGSSFLGEIFNRHKNVFYTYEPLHALNVFAKANVFPAYEYQRKAVDTLDDLFNCDYSNQDKYLNFISYPELSNPHFRLMSKTLSSPPLCDHVVAQNITEAEYRKHCKLLVPYVVENFCKQKNHVVIKELVHRIPSGSLSGLSRLLLESSFKAIYLTRDPRAIVWSLAKIGWIGKHDGSFAVSVKAAVKKVCQIFVNNHASLTQLTPVTHKKLIVLRYEDLVSQPVDVVTKLFDFSQLELNADTIDWVVENTHGQLDSDNTKESFSVLLRNVSYSLNSWRKHLSFAEISLIQRECGNTMRKFGYVLFSSPAEVQYMHLPAFNNDIPLTNIIMIK